MYSKRRVNGEVRKIILELLPNFPPQQVLCDHIFFSVFEQLASCSSSFTSHWM